MMWVNKKEWDKLKERVSNLEYRTQMDRAITVYDVDQNHYYPGIPLPSQSVEVQTLVMRILNHLGMGLKYVKGTPDKVDMVKLASPSGDEQR